MDLFKNIELRKASDYCAHYQATGRPEEFAKKLRIGESSLYILCKEVRNRKTTIN